MTVTQLDVSRHFELFDPYSFDTPIHIIGVGATGSWLALSLAKLGITNIHIWDFDTVEEHNIPNQAFSIADVGKAKVKALFDQIKFMTGTEVIPHNEKVERQRFAGIVFCMVDSMEGRRTIWENCGKMKSQVKLWVEPRMGLEVGRVYTVNPMDYTHIQKYEDTWYGDDVAEVSACGNSMTVINACLAIASWVTRQLITFVNDGMDELDNEILFDFKYNNIFPTRWSA